MYLIGKKYIFFWRRCIRNRTNTFLHFKTFSFISCLHLSQWIRFMYKHMYSYTFRSLAGGIYPSRSFFPDCQCFNPYNFKNLIVIIPVSPHRRQSSTILPPPQYPRKWKLSEKTTCNHNTGVMISPAKRVNFSFSSKFWRTAKKIIGRHLLTVRAEVRPTTGLTIPREAVKINENQISPTYASVLLLRKD